MKLKGKVTVITSGGSGVGKATAFLFAREGAQVVITGRRKGKLKEAIEEATNQGLELDYHQCDITNEEECNKVTYRLSEHSKKL